MQAGHSVDAVPSREEIPIQFDRLSVGARLYLGFGLILLILLAVTAIAVSKVHVINGALRENNEINASIQRYAINFRGSAYNGSIAVRDVVLSASPADRQKDPYAHVPTMYRCRLDKPFFSYEERRQGVATFLHSFRSRTSSGRRSPGRERQRRVSLNVVVVGVLVRLD